MTILARQCPWTKKLFVDDEQYSKHLSQIREKHRLARYSTAMREQGDRALQWATQNVSSCDEFKQWMWENWDALVVRGTYISLWNRSRITRTDQLVIPELKSVDLELTFNPFIRNSHSCPQDGVQNFMSRPELPCGYPGWEGRLKWSYHCPVKTRVSAGSDIFENSAVCTGTGSGGSDSSYDVILWASDWPAMTNWHLLKS